MTQEFSVQQQDYGLTSQSAWVVFTGKTDIRWLKILRSGFRHCYVVLNDGQRWFSIDPLSPYTDIQIYHHVATAFDLPLWLESRGNKVVKADINKAHNKPAPWMFFTCVESIKRILGIHQRFIITPWQLYQYLQQSSPDKKKSENPKGDFSWVV